MLVRLDYECKIASKRKTLDYYLHGQPGHMKTNKHCPKYRENTESHSEGIDTKKSTGKPSSSYLSGQVKLKPINNKKPVPKSATKVSVDEAPKGDNSETPGSSMAQPKESKVESDRPSHSLMPAFTRERGESESQQPSLSGQPCSSTERNQAASSRHTISITQPSLRMDKDHAKLVIRPPREREQPQRELVMKRSIEIADYDRSSLEESSRFESRKTMRMADSQMQQRFRLSENSLDRGPKEDRIWREEREISTECHREGRVRRDYGDMTVSEEANEIVEIRRYEDVIRSEREEEERHKAKKNKKLQPEIIERYVED